MFDFKFDWDNSMNLGVDIMDIQHKELFRIARKMEQLLLTHCIGATEKQLLEVVCELREYVTYHFYQEEEFMKNAGYEKLKEHKMLHDKFVQEIINFRCERLGTNPYESIKMLKDELQEWVFSHVMMEDKKMVSELKNYKFIGK